MHPLHHAQSSVKKWGGCVDDYLPLHSWFDETKEHFADHRHRALRHHSQGIFEAERVFGVTITNADGELVPVRAIGEQHVVEDLGRIPTVQDWLVHIDKQPWMSGVQRFKQTEVLDPNVTAQIAAALKP